MWTGRARPTKGLVALTAQPGQARYCHHCTAETVELWPLWLLMVGRGASATHGRLSYDCDLILVNRRQQQRVLNLKPIG